MGRTHERIKTTHCMFDTSPSKWHCTEALRKNSGKKLEVSSQQSACQNHPVNAPPAIMKNFVCLFIVSQTNTLTRVAHDIACSQIGLRSVPHANMRYCMKQLLSLVSRIPQILKIGQTSFGISQVHDGNALRYTNFILFQIWITSDGTSGKVNMFTHQVTTQTSPLRRARMAFTGRPDFCSA
jgi:hypothetical protein